MTIKVSPRKFKSKRMDAMFKRLGELPALMNKIGGTLTTKIKRNLNGRILQRRTGNLHDSWEWATEAFDKGWRVIIGSDISYARIHDIGGVTGRNHATVIPARRYVSIAFVETKKLIRKLGRDFLASVTRE